MIYAFDVDETLECSGGPVRIEDVVRLKQQGHIVGLCGNWAMAAGCEDPHPRWDHVFAFLGSMGLTKAKFLEHIQQYIRADGYVMVGNVFGTVPYGGSNDKGAAIEAGWRFISETEFAQGKR